MCPYSVPLQVSGGTSCTQLQPRPDVSGGAGVSASTRPKKLRHQLRSRVTIFQSRFRFAAIARDLAIILGQSKQNLEASTHFSGRDDRKTIVFDTGNYRCYIAVWGHESHEFILSEESAHETL